MGLMFKTLPRRGVPGRLTSLLPADEGLRGDPNFSSLSLVILVSFCLIFVEIIIPEVIVGPALIALLLVVAGEEDDGTAGAAMAPGGVVEFLTGFLAMFCVISDSDD